MNKYMHLIFILLIAGCSSPVHQEDPLKNSKKLMKEGHVSLYKNGAFKVPMTTLTLIPPGPTPFEIAKDLVGVRAKQSFFLSVKRAKESVYVVSEGTKYSFKTAGKISQKTDAIVKYIKENSRPSSRFVIEKSAALSLGIVGKSWEVSKNAIVEFKNLSFRVKNNSAETADIVASYLDTESEYALQENKKVAAAFDHNSKMLAIDSGNYSIQSFVQGNLAIPKNLAENVSALKESKTLENFSKDFNETEDTRKKFSSQMTYVIGNTIEEYGKNVNSTISKGHQEIAEKSSEYGYTFATLRAFRYYLQAIFFDAVIVPSGKITGAALGYLTINTVAYPTVLVVREGVNVAELAVEVGYGVGKSAFDITAPTVAGVCAGTFSLLARGGGKLVTYGLEGAGLAYSGAVQGSKLISTVAIKGGGQAASFGIEYVGVPMATIGVNAVGAASGIAIGSAGVIAGGATFLGGEVLQGTTYVGGKTVAGTTAVVGTGASIVGGAAVSLYEVGTAMVVPPSYALGSGVVLGYGTLAHLGAQTVLAVSDAAYMVLSLEGPRWVLYAVQGKLSSGEELSSGMVLDLEKMKKNGETFYKVPASDQEIKEVLESLDKSIPEE